MQLFRVVFTHKKTLGGYAKCVISRNNVFDGDRGWKLNVSSLRI
jgi:hypothetical protein